MPNPFHNAAFDPIYVDHICWLTAEDHLYTLDWPTPDDYFYVSPHIYMEDHYYGRVGTLTRSLMADGKRLTAGDLAFMVMERLSTKAHWDWLILAQTYPERHALSAPLARMLETAAWQVNYPLGLSHMGALAGTEAIQAAQWSIRRKERAAIVLAEQRVFHDDGQAGYGFQTESHGDTADMAVALQASTDQGALQVHYVGKKIIQSGEADSFASQVRNIIRELMHDCTAEHMILQSRLGMHISGNAILHIGPDKTVCVPYADYQSGDVWIQLAEKLQRGVIKPEERVVLVSWDGDLMLSACCVHVIHLPLLSGLAINQEIKTT